jgi:hypothetical protein
VTYTQASQCFSTHGKVFCDELSILCYAPILYVMSHFIYKSLTVLTAPCMKQGLRVITVDQNICLTNADTLSGLFDKNLVN